MIKLCFFSLTGVCLSAGSCWYIS